jgi:hypothetical protein
MTWHRFKLWRFALSYGRQGTMWDGDGRWRHVLGPLWVLADRSDPLQGAPDGTHYHWPQYRPPIGRDSGGPS